MPTDDIPDSGQLPGRYEFVPEPSRGGVPTDPAFERFSDVIRSWEADPGSSKSRQDALGTADAVDHNRGMEEPTFTCAYDLQRAPVTVNFDDPELTDTGATAVGVRSTDSGDTGLDVTVYNNAETQSETITTDGSDATTFVSGSTTLNTIGRVAVSGSPAGSIEVLEDDSGSAGTKFGETGTGNTDVDDVEPAGPEGHGILRDEYNRVNSSLLALSRRERPGGNDDAGVREYQVIRGATLTSAEPTLDPSEENPILMETEWQPQKVRSYLIHQPSSATTLTVSSDDSADTNIDVQIESEGATKSETITTDGTDGTVEVTGATSFPDIDAVWLSEKPVGTITVTDGNGTTLMKIDGGKAYSDDSQPVDGDRGVPVLGSGSRASDIGTGFEFFVGDRFERPAGSAVRPRVNSASWTVENDPNTQTVHSSRLPAVDGQSRTVSVDADVAGRFASHNSMRDSLLKDQANLEHELTSVIIVFRDTTPTDSATEERTADEGVASLSETLEASGDISKPPIDFLRV